MQKELLLLSTGGKLHSSVVMGGQLTFLGGRSSPTSTEFIIPSLSSTWTEGYPLIEYTGASCAVKLTRDTFLVTGGGYYSHVVLYDIIEGTGRRLQDLNSELR